MMSLCACSAHGADFNNDGLSDVWGAVYNATGLTSAADSDGDGLLNWQEDRAGTDPLNPDSVHEVTGGGTVSNRMEMRWRGYRGKRYELWQRTNLLAGGWVSLTNWYGANSNFLARLPLPDQPDVFHSIQVSDVDSDGDGLSDWEEYAIGLNPGTNRSNRTSNTDSNKVRNAMRATNQISVAALDRAISEDWPDPGVFAIRRTGRVDRITVPFTIGGGATLNTDYTLSTNGSITLEPGVREVWVEVHPLADVLSEGEETITLTLNTSVWYRLGQPQAATVTLANASAGTASAKAAARLLTQASFGATTSDIAQVQQMGLTAWVSNQLALPPSYLRPVMNVVTTAYDNVYSSHKILAWWERALNAPDQLRQRMAFALSEIIVVSDDNGTLEGNWDTVIGFYDLLLEHAFGNYRDLLKAVSIHPAMGVYLSHMGNQKADPETGRFPDENYAREIMQLFSIGLWELNQDGTRKLTNNLPIPTYGNADITELARVFTGLSWGTGNTNLWWEFYWPEVYSLTAPLQMWQEFHDTNTKVLVRGQILPANQSGMKDVDDAIANLANHPNVGPFLGRRLIQRFVTSNPSTGYVARVAAVFNDNGSGVRGDLKAVLSAILLDPEAREPAWIQDPTFGKQREPYVRLVNLGRAFQAAASNGFYEMWWLDDMYAMQPMSSPSVFNFFSPDFRPNGPLKDANLTAPEFQITTAVTGISAPNHFLTASYYGLNRWPGDPETTVYLNLNHLLGLAGDVDALLQQLDLVLTYGNLRPAHHQVIREALERIPFTSAEDRVRMAVYLITTSPEFCILK
jgi:uncharacterized protein (DUF1800 family)